MGRVQGNPPAEGSVRGPRGDVQPDTAAGAGPSRGGGRAPSALSPAGRLGGQCPTLLPRRGWERAAGGISPRPQSRLWSSVIPGRGREGGRKGGRRQRISSISPQGRAAGLTWGSCSVLGSATGKPNARGEGLAGGEPPSLPRPPRSGSGACARPGHREGAAFEAAALDTRVGLGGTRMEIKTNHERTIAK